MKLRGLELLRGVAALSVVVAHSDSSIGNNAALHFARWHAFEFPGMPGVEFFFVLSGFVMALMHGGDIGRGGNVGSFLWRRVCRLYPLFLVMLAIPVWQYWGAPIINAAAVLAWASLLPIRTDNLVVVAWTLRQEIVFYLMFSVCMLPRFGPLWLAGWIGGNVAWWFLGWRIELPGVAGTVVSHVFSFFSFEFFAGLLAGLLLRHVSPRRGRASLLLLAASTLLVWRMSLDGWGSDYGPPVARLVYGAAYGGIILGVAMLERAGALPFRGWAGRVAEFAGIVSYPLYLVHLPVIGWVADQLGGSGLAAKLGPDICFAIFVIASVAASVAVAYGVDRPLQAGLRGLSLRFSAGSRSSPAAQV